MEKRSCRKPGTVISSVRMQPPATALRSSTQTRLPLRVSMAAQTSELMPLPTMMMSKESMEYVREMPGHGGGYVAPVGGGGRLASVGRKSGEGDSPSAQTS